ncbi:hypothetical protein BCLUESOX_760 [bacterium endosymbiont of Bathymodiolus sp. 5 South]|nr:hypothetical protein BCLUESOX_760 [bacterium endosymbiont of Bathymodiolus sp. 5 South]VVH57752.1 hypothetical protein BSPCLSOX_1177 [uncultured Gammaproteobacteria bacterium]VVH64016.1 hypothetical protein BSPWISOX_2734 [uncultured Gammaproteobacteria bacterium]
MDSFWLCFVGEKNDYYTLFIVLLFFEFCITVTVKNNFVKILSTFARSMESTMIASF